MDLQRWHRIGEIYHEALQLAEPARIGFVDSFCEGDAELRDEVCSLLRSDEISGDFLQDGVFHAGLKIMLNCDATTFTEITTVGSVGDTLPGTTLDGRYLIE